MNIDCVTAMIVWAYKTQNDMNVYVQGRSVLGVDRDEHTQPQLKSYNQTRKYTADCLLAE